MIEDVGSLWDRGVIGIDQHGMRKGEVGSKGKDKIHTVKKQNP